MPVVYRPSLAGGSLAGVIFLVFLFIGIWSAFYYWFVLWIFCLPVFYFDYNYYVIVADDKNPKDEAETVELLKKDELKF